MAQHAGVPCAAQIITGYLLMLAVELRNHSEVLPNFTVFLKDILGVRKLVIKKLPREVFNS